MIKFSLGRELTRNEQKKVLGGWARCNNGYYFDHMTCTHGAGYCQAHGGLHSCG